MKTLITLLLLIIGHDVYAAEVLLRKSSVSSFSQAQQHFLLMKENQRLKKELQRLKEINNRANLLQQNGLVGSEIGKIADISIIPSYSLLEIGIQKEKLQQQVDAHMQLDFPGAQEFWAVQEAVTTSIGTTAQAFKDKVKDLSDEAATKISNGLATAAKTLDDARSKAEHTLHQAAGLIKDLPKDAAQVAVSSLKKEMERMVGKCNEACFTAIVESTKARIGQGESMNLVYIGQTAFEHFKEDGMLKMLIGVVFNSLNGLFDWVIPDLRAKLKSLYTSKIRPMFASKTQAIRNALVKYSSMNIYDAMQSILTDHLRHSIQATCALLPSFSFVVEINVPPYCVTIVEQILRGLPWMYGIAEMLARTIDNTIAIENREDFKELESQKAPADEAPAKKAPADKAPADKAPAHKAPADKAPSNKGPSNKGPVGEILQKVTALSIVQFFNQPIGEIVQSQYKTVANSLKEIVDNLFHDPALALVTGQADELAKTDCKDDDLMCMLDTITNLLFLLFDKRLVQITAAGLLHERMNTVIYKSGAFDYLLHFDGLKSQPDS